MNALGRYHWHRALLRAGQAPIAPPTSVMNSLRSPVDNS